MRNLPFLALTASLLALPASAQQSIVPYLPPNTVVAFSAPDLATTLREFGNMPMAKMWREEEVQKFVADLSDMVKAKIGEGIAQLRELHSQGQFPLDPDELMNLRINGMTCAVTHLEVIEGERGPEPNLGLVVHLDFGASAPKWAPLIDQMVGKLQEEAGDKMQVSSAKVGNCEIVSMLPPERAKLGHMGLHMAKVGNGLLLGTLHDEVAEVVHNLLDQQPALGKQPLYEASAKHLTVGGAECESFVRLDAMVEFGMQAFRQAAKHDADLQEVDMDGVERAIKAMGLRDLGTWGLTSTYEDNKCIWRTAHQGHALASTSAVKNVDMSFLKWVPKDAVSFSASTLDVMSIYGMLVAGLNAYDEQLAKQVFAQVEQVEKQIGFNIRDELFGAFGDHMVTWAMPWSTVTSPPESAYLIKVTDEAKLVHVIKALTALSQGHVELEESEKRGLKVYTLHLNLDDVRGMNGINPLEMFVPTFSFKNGYLVLAFSASDVKRIFQRMDREDDPKGDIRSNKEFAALADRLPKDVQSVSFTDWKAQFESIYQIATGLLAFLPVGEDVPIDMALLPDSATLTRHLFGELSYGKADALGSESVTVSPFGPELVVVVIGAMVGVGVGVTVARQGGF